MAKKYDGRWRNYPCVPYTKAIKVYGSISELARALELPRQQVWREKTNDPKKMSELSSRRLRDTMSWQLAVAKGIVKDVPGI